MKRRHFIKRGGIVAAIMAGLPQFDPGAADPAPVFLVVSGWQTANIGDIAHTPGMLSLLYHYFPGSKCILWPKNINPQVENMLLSNFPELDIIYFDPAENNPDQEKKFGQVLESSDMLIHSSGPGVIGIDKLIYWKAKTPKPYGIIGVTLGGIGEELKEILDDAAFIYTRETYSLKILEKEGIKAPVSGFAPDSTFALTLADRNSARKFMENHQLKEKEYICVIPRLRYTPYHEIYPDIGWSDEKIQEVTETNDRYKYDDHEKMREVIGWWMTTTGQKVVICPEMTYQVSIMDPLLIDPLPEDYKKNIVKHDYWLPDEAASLYEKAFTVISMECHSPIIAAANGTPCFYLRQPQDTIKGQMWYDLGLDRWVFEIEETSGQDIIRELNNVVQDYGRASDYLGKAMTQVRERYRQTFQTVGRIVKI